MHVVYVPDSFPQPSETFVINEIDGFLKNGVQISVVPRIIGDIGKTQHARLQVILPLINVVFGKRGFDVKAFFIGLKYGSQVWFGWRPHSLVKHIRNAISIACHVAIIKRQKPDVVLIHFGYDNAIAGSIAAGMLNIPSVLWLHGSDMYTVPHRKLIWLTDHVSEVVTHSNYAVNLLRKLGVTKRIIISCLGVNTNKFDVDENKQQRPTLICIARLGHNKNHLALINIFNKIKDRAPDTDLWLVGDGPYFNKYKKLVSDKKVENITFWGALSQEEIVELLGKAWIKVLLSEKEGFPVVLMETQVAGLPCVASSVGGVPELIINGKTGFLFDLYDTEFNKKVADAIINLIINQQLRETMGKYARTRAMKLFDEKAHIERMFSLVQRLVRKS